MKKLMIMVAAVTVATFAQAASIDWSFSQQALDKNAPASLDGYTAYLFTSATWSAAETAGVTAGLFDTALDSATLTKTTGGSGANTWNRYVTGTQIWTADAAASGNYVVVLFNGDSYVASDDIAATAYTSTQESHTAANWAIAANKTPITSGDMTSIPEPTSGLLLLVGAAALALRRRKA